MNNKDMPADELPGMWDASDLQGGEADCAEDLRARKELFLLKVKLREAAREFSALKEENERLNLQLSEAFKPGPDDLFHDSKESVRSCANAWLRTMAKLKENDPDFWKRGKSGSECAIARIDALKTRVAELENDLRRAVD